ncbi:MAG: hypothetical protein VSS52_009550, partial [Thiotrichaceae bacterium]|nr:hypothetical protein [Thiotrichaceae bacterium]
AFDLWAGSDLVDVIKARQEITEKPKAAFVLSRVVKNTRLLRQAKEVLQAHEFKLFEAMTVNRAIYAQCVTKGKTVFDTSNNAVMEMRAMARELQEFTHA